MKTVPLGSHLAFLEENRIAVAKDAVLVDNAWSAPGATGFPAELLLNPIINSVAGVPAAAGKNTAILKNELNIVCVVMPGSLDIKLESGSLILLKER